MRFSYHSPDGENGFPGNLDIKVTYTLQEDNAIRIDYDGVSDKKTVINVTNHSYFNLNGHDSGSICDERVMIQADAFTELGAGSIPTGRILQVEGTPMDLRSGKRVGDEIDADFGQLTLTGGYDHNWVLQNHGNLEKVAQVEDDASGIVMDAYTVFRECSFMQETLLPRRREKMEYLTETVRRFVWRCSIFRIVYIIRNFRSRYLMPDSIIMHLLFTNFDNKIRKNASASFFVDKIEKKRICFGKRAVTFVLPLGRMEGKHENISEEYTADRRTWSRKKNTDRGLCLYISSAAGGR